MASPRPTVQAVVRRERRLRQSVGRQGGRKDRLAYDAQINTPRPFGPPPLNGGLGAGVWSGREMHLAADFCPCRPRWGTWDRFMVSGFGGMHPQTDFCPCHPQWGIWDDTSRPSGRPPSMGTEVGRHESTAFENAPQSTSDCRIDFGRPQKWTQNRVRWTSVLPILDRGLGRVRALFVVK